MKTISIVLLSVLLIGVSVAFFFDHTAQVAKLNTANIALTQLQEKSAKQTKTGLVLINCANATEKAYVATKKYVSVVACVRAGLK
ncbi:MAG: hypothetical protein WC444_02830 [Candidatus Paceibacterota bacterium]